jgi:hypothetical protein
VKKYEPFYLEDAESKEVWGLIHSADIPNRKSLTRPGVPGEVSFTFQLPEKNKKDKFRQWERDAMKVEEIHTLVTTLGSIMTRETKSTNVWFVAQGEPRGKSTYHATLDGRTVALHPSGTTFEIPASFLKWHKQFKNNLHLSRAELQKVERGAGDWDTEYAKVINAVLPFDKCAVHIGGEGWGRDAVSFADLQMPDLHRRNSSKMPLPSPRSWPPGTATRKWRPGKRKTASGTSPL